MTIRRKITSTVGLLIAVFALNTVAVGKPGYSNPLDHLATLCSGVRSSVIELEDL
jgi:hypothetical protein